MADPVRLPPWTYAETVLAYDLYLQEYASPQRYADAAHPAVVRLSNELRALKIHPDQVRADPRFRNPAGVARKVQNLMWRATGETAGSPNGSAVDVQVVSEHPDAAEVRALARTVRRDHSAATTAAPPTLPDYQAALPDGPLDRAALSSRRAEQGLLRQYLLAGRTEAPCAFCGDILPADLLVAAHTQRRADLSDEERARFGSVAVLACALGCDALFEAGYLAVADNGVIVATEVTTPPAVRERLDRLEGRLCTEHTPERAAGFAEHRRTRLIRST